MGRRGEEEEEDGDKENPFLPVSLFLYQNVSPLLEWKKDSYLRKGDSSSPPMTFQIRQNNVR